MVASQCFPAGICGPLALEAQLCPRPALHPCESGPCSSHRAVCAHAYSGGPGCLSPWDTQASFTSAAFLPSSLPFLRLHQALLLPHLWNFGLSQNGSLKAHRSRLPEPSTFFVGRSKASLQSLSGPRCFLQHHDVPFPHFRPTCSLPSDPERRGRTPPRPTDGECSARPALA